MDDQSMCILLAGCGGQGVLTAAQVLTGLFAKKGREVVSGQLHCMAQRGGCVQSFVKVDRGASPAVAAGGADVVLGLEPMETLRALPFFAPGATVFMNTAVVLPFVISQDAVRGREAPGYPEMAVISHHIYAVTRHLFAFDATHVAEQAGSAAAVSTVMLGCLAGSGRLDESEEAFLAAVESGTPGKLAEVNTRAFLAGVERGRAFRAVGGVRCP